MTELFFVQNKQQLKIIQVQFVDFDWISQKVHAS